MSALFIFLFVGQRYFFLLYCNKVKNFYFALIHCRRKVKMSIDFRVRPPIASYRNAEFYNNIADVSQRAARFNAKISPCAATFSMEALIREMDECGVSRAVVPIRKGCGGNNEDLLFLLKNWPSRFIGLAGIAPFMGMEQAFNELRQYVIDGPCSGIALEPAFDPEPWHADDERVFPLYEKCQAEKIPVVFTFGGIFTPKLDLYSPFAIDTVAKEFPEMQIALSHGGWPFVTEFCQLAFNRGNIYLAPDMYMLNAPGSADYIAAANGILYDRMIFASAAPIISIKDAERHYKTCGIKEEFLPYVMEKNACRFLRL